MVTELDPMASKIVERASPCDVKDCCQRAISECLDDSVRQGIYMCIYMFITKPQSLFLKIENIIE